MADPFEEFEFKPLTEGLGFHKKADKIKTDIKSTNFVEDRIPRPVPEAPPRSMLFEESAQVAPRNATQSINELIASLPPSLDFLEGKQDLSRPGSASIAARESTTSRPQIFQPLVREEMKTSGPTLATTATSPTVGAFLPAPGTKAGSKNQTAMTGTMAPATAAPLMNTATTAQPNRQRALDESFARAFPRSEKTQAKAVSRRTTGELEAVPANLTANVLDAMVVAGFSTVLLVCILAITKINLVALLTNAQTDLSTQFHLGLLFLAVLQIYMLVARSFFGATLGEWAFELQLGRDQDMKRPMYPVLVACRTLVTTVTGLVVLPLLSLVLKRDLGRYVSGLQLYRRP